MSKVSECNLSCHIIAQGSEEDLTGGKDGTWLVMDPSSPCILSSVFFRGVLREVTL